MIGILVVTHENLGEHLIRCASHVVGESPTQLMHFGVFVDDEPAEALVAMRDTIQQLDTGDGVLILCDIYGATPCNIATRLTEPGKVVCITSANLPMLVRALSYRNQNLSTVVEKALEGGKKTMMVIPEEIGNAT